MLFISTATLVSALAFCATLTGLAHAAGPRPQCIEKYRVPESNVTCAAIGQQAEVNQTSIESMNPGVNCNGTLTPGDMLCTKQYTPVCTKNATATGSTCDGLADTWNITKDNFVQYNDGINDSCDDLVSGNPYCVSVDGCYPGNADTRCQQ